MIFVTVGTHEQPFNRLVEYMDHLKLDEDVVIQTGYSTYVPHNCKWSNLFPYSEMLRYVQEARIVITHGGPSSFIMPLQIGKIPIVVPRRKCFNEHVNDHQVEFCHAVADRMRNIVLIDDVNELLQTIDNYDSIVHTLNSKLNSNNNIFCNRLENLISGLLSGQKIK